MSEGASTIETVIGASLEERFWAKVRKMGPNDCWLWMAGTSPAGYGLIAATRTRKLIGAHRVSWQLANGPIPQGMEVCHHCDNPPCVNPAHLFLGSHRDNMRDAMAKGRNSPPPLAKKGRATVMRGERVHTAVLTENDVLVVRARAAAGESKASIARSYGMTPQGIRRVVQRLSWRHVA